MANGRFANSMSRRGFLTVGSIGLGGLTLADVLPAAGPGRPEELRGDHGQGRLGDPHLPARRDRPPGDVRSQTVRPHRVPGRHGLDRDQDRRRAIQPDASPDRPACRQADGDSLDDARRGGPRARHAQHVHGLPAQPGPPVSRAWEASSLTSTVPRTILPPYVCVPNQPNVYAGTGYLSSSFSPFSLGRDPADPGFQVQDLNLPGGINESRFTTPADGARRGQRPLRRAREERQHRGDGYVLPAGLQPDQLAEGPRGVQYRRRAGQDPRRVRPQPGRPALADGAPAGGRRRAVRHRRVRRLGHAHPDRRRNERPDAGLRPGASPP